MVAVAETGRIPVDNPATHLELTMIHEAMVSNTAAGRLTSAPGLNITPAPRSEPEPRLRPTFVRPLRPEISRATAAPRDCVASFLSPANRGPPRTQPTLDGCSSPWCRWAIL
jgi:hypothetical protein